VLADQIVNAVTRCPDVAGLTQAPGNPVATYLPGRTVSGGAVRAGEGEICVGARYGRPLPPIAGQGRRALAPLVPDRVVDVVMGDTPPPDPRPAPGPPSPSRRKAVTQNREESANG